MGEPLCLRYMAARRRALESIKKIAPSIYEVGQSSKSVPEQEGVERISAFRQPTLITWVDPEDDRVYTNIPAYAPPASSCNRSGTRHLLSGQEWLETRSSRRGTGLGDKVWIFVEARAGIGGMGRAY
ncbi:hypothetical protein Tco_1288046 [Tanacetum coccineum]